MKCIYMNAYTYICSTQPITPLLLVDVLALVPLHPNNVRVDFIFYTCLFFKPAPEQARPFTIRLTH